jgi:hypothetical protein
LPGDQPITRDLSSCGEHSPKTEPEPHQDPESGSIVYHDATATTEIDATREGFRGRGSARLAGGTIVPVVNFAFSRPIPRGSRLALVPLTSGEWRVHQWESP